MQYNSNKVFPHPVLRRDNDDYQGGYDFQFTLESQSKKDGIHFTFEFDLSEDAPLVELIKKEQACYAVLIKSIETGFRHLESGFDNQFAYFVEEGILGGKITISPYIVSCVDIKGFSSPLIHPEFGKKSFDFASGTVLAIDEEKNLYVTSKVHLGSVFEIEVDNAMGDDEYRYDRDYNHIIISVSKSFLDKLKLMRSAPKGDALLMQGIYFPIIVSLLHELDADEKDGDGIDEELKWVRAFCAKLEEQNLALPGSDKEKNRLSDAQKLLEGSLQEFLTVTDKIINDD
ncbi:MAG: hypothetical protein GDA50_03530 [Alphaproteobacteria bacterium GM202ARS2]|nr:hypothetical protein [Alphaproteobacteria bacterium GM202ARS2]